MWFTPRHVLEQRITLPLEIVRETVVVFSETQENCFANYNYPSLYYRQSGLVQSGVSHGDLWSGPGSPGYGLAPVARRVVASGVVSPPSTPMTPISSISAFPPASFVTSPLCCMDRGCGRTEPEPCSGSCDADILRASQLQHSVQHSAAMATSLACRPSVCDRSPSPMTRFQRDTSASTRARQLYPEALCQPMRPRSAIHRRCRSRCVGALSAAALGTAFRAAARPRPQRDGGPRVRRRHRRGRRRRRR